MSRLLNTDGSTLSTVTTGATGVEREVTLRRSILILLLVSAGAVDPWSDEAVVIGVTDSAPVVELANKESLSLAMAGATTLVSGGTTADNPCKGNSLLFQKGTLYQVSWGPSRGHKIVLNALAQLF